MFVYHVPEAAI